MFNKKLKQRIVSLEDMLGVAYVPSEDKYGWNSHVVEEQSLIRDIKDLLKTKKK